MNKEKITQSKIEIETKFNELETQKQDLLNKVKEIEIEEIRLQGEYRLLVKMENEIVQPEVVETIVPVEETPVVETEEEVAPEAPVAEEAPVEEVKVEETNTNE